MKYRIDFRPYRRKFSRIVRLRSGIWVFREGVIVRLEDAQGRVGYGEVAPLPDFGTETLKEALAWLQTLGGQLDDEGLLQTPASVPCCRSALEAAWLFLHEAFPGPRQRTLHTAALIGGGWPGIQDVHYKVLQGYRTLKWKASNETINDVAVLREVLKRLPKGFLLRIDANATLGETFTAQLLEQLDTLPIDYLEQPLPAEAIETLRFLACRYRTPIALDESVSGFDRLRQILEEGWKGPVIIKPALLGPLRDFLAWRRERPNRFIYSSAFETAVGYETTLRLAAESPRKETHGLGVLDFIEPDGLTLHTPAAKIKSGRIGTQQFHALWEQLGSKR